MTTRSSALEVSPEAGAAVGQASQGVFEFGAPVAAPQEKPILGVSARSARLAAVVTPLYRLPLSADEEISLRHLRNYLGHFDRFLIGPEELLRSAGVAAKHSDFAIRPFANKYFTSVQGYSRLMVTENFYRAFSAYDYILMYQLDCLVFSSDLESWCRGGWDYIGAPLFEGFRNDPAGGLWMVGNGGFSLRKVESALNVLNSKRLLDDPKVRGPETKRFGSSPELKRMLIALRTFFLECGFHNTARWMCRELEKHPEFYFQEDLFWAQKGPRLLQGFNIASLREALSFSFEMAPRYCYQENGGRLPFGCHAWAKHDREFWEPFLLK